MEGRLRILLSKSGLNVDSLSFHLAVWWCAAAVKGGGSRSWESELIPFNIPYTSSHVMPKALEALRGSKFSGDGPAGSVASEYLERISGSDRVLLTPSCTAALELAAILLDIKPGDEVIMPSFTFVSTANAFVLRGACPVFVDVRPDTFNIDERLIEAAITKRTRAIVVVHYGGVGCEMDSICAIAEDHGLFVVEDNAHGLGGSYRGQKLGTFGALSTLSFHETKNVQCGEGGALAVNDETMLEAAEIIREKGTNRSRFFRGQVDKYTWVSVGSSFLLPELLAAVLIGQLEQFDFIQDRRHEIWRAYRDGLEDWAKYAGFTFQDCPDDRNHTAHLFALLAPDSRQRDLMITHLRDLMVNAVFHYIPLHSSPWGSRFGLRDLPVTDSVSERLIRFPLYPSLSSENLDRVISAVNLFRL